MGKSHRIKKRRFFYNEEQDMKNCTIKIVGLTALLHCLMLNFDELGKGVLLLESYHLILKQVAPLVLILLRLYEAKAKKILFVSPFSNTGQRQLYPLNKLTQKQLLYLAKVQHHLPINGMIQRQWLIKTEVRLAINF